MILNKLMLEHKYISGRSEAKRLTIQGQVRVDGELVLNPFKDIKTPAVVSVRKKSQMLG